MIAGQDKAAYVVSNDDVGYILKVVGTPIVKESREVGALVSAHSPVVSWPEGAENEMGATGNDSTEAHDVGAPELTDWKIEMNPRQEYRDPITLHYEYAGGTEGNTIIEWFREVITETGDVEERWEPIEMAKGIRYQPYIDDVNKRIKIFITPVRSDGVVGPTYQHILERLVPVQAISDSVAMILREAFTKGVSFVVHSFDPRDQHAPTAAKKLHIQDKQVKVKVFDGEKTEFKTKLTPDCMVIRAWPHDNRCFELIFPATKTNPKAKTYSMLCNDGDNRDITVTVLRNVAM